MNGAVTSSDHCFNLAALLVVYTVFSDDQISHCGRNYSHDKSQAFKNVYGDYSVLLKAGIGHFKSNEYDMTNRSTSPRLATAVKRENRTSVFPSSKCSGSLPIDAHYRT
jgi:hypothetical protein